MTQTQLETLLMKRQVFDDSATLGGAEDGNNGSLRSISQNALTHRLLAGTYLGWWGRGALCLGSRRLTSPPPSIAFQSLSLEHQVRMMNEEDVFDHLTG